jgi:Hemerythrin HHE cation binding domain
MKRRPDGPPDTRMVGVVNDAFRRDVARLQTALAAVPPLPAAPRETVVEHCTWLMRLVTDFHAGVDAGLYPLVRAKNPYAGDLLDAMIAQHREIAARASVVVGAAAQWTNDANVTAQRALATAFDALADVLLPHLHLVEVELMPVVIASLTEREWRSWDRACMLDPRSKAEMAEAGNWLLDDLDEERREVTLNTISRWERLVMVRVYERRHRRAQQRNGVGPLEAEL